MEWDELSGVGMFLKKQRLRTKPEVEDPGVSAGTNRRGKGRSLSGDRPGYFMRSKLFCRICQSACVPTLAR